MSDPNGAVSGGSADGKESTIFAEAAFDVILTELIAPDENKEEPLVASTKLIAFAKLKELSASNGDTLRSLPISKLRSRLSRGHFCLKKKPLIEIASSTTLAEYARRQPNAGAIGGKEDGPSLAVFWTRPTVDLKNTLKELKDHQPGSATVPSVEKPDIKPREFEGGVETSKSQTISMKEAKPGDSLYDLDTEKWSYIIGGNELLYGFQVNTEQADRLQKLKIDALLSSAVPSDENSNITTTSSTDPLNLVQRCARPAFILAPESTNGTAGEDNSHTSSAHNRTFWCQPSSEAKTEIMKAENSLQVWSTKSGMSKWSVDAGASFPIGKATLGAKFGFEREKAHTEKSSTEKSETHFMAVHLIPKAQINVNETTVLLSSDAEADIKKLRQQRRFSDLLHFFEKFGTLVFQNIILGGRLFHIQDTASSKKEEAETNSVNLKASASASLGIPGILDGNLGGSYERGNSTATGSLATKSVANLSWTSIGGNASMSVDPPRWRDSLGDYSTWRPIQYENAIRIDTFIGRLKGFSDIPLLFATILATGVLDRSIVAIPPNVFQFQQNKGSVLKLGGAVDPITGKLLEPTLQRKSVAPRKMLSAPAGFSWVVFTTDRSLKREIRANLQSSLNPMVNIPYTPPFLSTLRADKDTFTIMLKWTSATWKEMEDESVTTKMQKYAAYKLLKEGKEKKAEDLKKSRDAQAVAEDEGKTDDQKAANKAKRQAEWTAADQVATGVPAKAAEEATTEAKTMNPMVEEEKQLKAGNYYFRSLTSRAWIIGLWTVHNNDEMSDDNFMELRATFEREFGQPKGIEVGCDYIVAKTSSKDFKLDVKFKMYVSDGNQGDEVPQPKQKKTSAKNAFEYIDARMRLSNINFLYVAGEIVTYDGSTPAESSLNESALLQYQEAQAGITFLQAKEKKTSDLTAKLEKSKDIILNKAKVFDVAILDDIRAAEDLLADEAS